MVMTVECPSCGTSFPVDPAKIPEGGVKARCTVCSDVFRVERPEEEVTPEAAVEREPEEAATGDATRASLPEEESTPPADAEPEPEPEVPEAPPEDPVEDPVEASLPDAGSAMRVDAEPEPEPESDSAEAPQPDPDPAPAALEAEESAFRVDAEPEPEPEPESEADEAPGRDPFQASLPGEEPASQADTESLAEPVEADAHDPTADGDWQAWSGAGAATVDDEEEHEDLAEPESSSEVGGFEGTEPEMDETDDWVFETGNEPPTAADEWSAPDPDPDDAFGDGMALAEEEGSPPADEPAPEMEMDADEDDGPSLGAGQGAMEMEPPRALVEEEGDPEAVAQAEEARTGVAPPEAKPDGPVQGFSFGQRDPADKARRLARVLVSDMIMYNPERHQRALANDSLAEDFEEEITKSWKEYVDQVGEEMAEETGYWKAALNDILAKGEEVF